MADTLEIPQPRENHRLFGHETVEAALHDACNAERLHHSLLFAGPGRHRQSDACLQVGSVPAEAGIIRAARAGCPGSLMVSIC